MYIALNNAYSTLAAGINDTVTTIVVQTGHGTRFAVGANYTYVTLENSGGDIEICKLTGQTGDSLTVVRGQDGTTARSWVSGDVIECRPCAAAIDDIRDEADALGVAAVSAHLSDTTDAHDASAISYAGATGLSATDVEAALDELDAEKRGIADDVLLAAGKGVVFEGATDDAHETTLSAEDPTADNSLVLPNKSGTLATTDDTAYISVPVRQTVLSGPVDANGYAAFLTTGSGLRPGFDASPTPVVIAFAEGYGSSGAADQVTVLSADASDPLGADLPASNLSYLYATYSSASAVTWGSTLNPPQYGYAYDLTRNSLLRFAGTDGSTSILDDYGNTWTAAGNAQIDTAQFKYGTGSLLCDGTGDYISNTQINSLGTDGWTVDFFVRFNALPASGQNMMLFSAMQAGAIGAGVSLALNNTTGTYKLNLALSSNGSSDDILAATVGTNTTWATGTWYHIVVAYDAVSGHYRTYKDGVADHAAVSSSARIGYFAEVRFGSGALGTTVLLNGWLDDCRISQFCRYPAGTAFTPPASEASVEGHFFSVPEMKMYEVTSASGTAGTSPGMTARNRVFVGEATTSGAAVTSAVSYAYRGEYMGQPVTVATSTATTWSHNIGVEPDFLEFTTLARNPSSAGGRFWKPAVAYQSGTVLTEPLVASTIDGENSRVTTKTLTLNSGLIANQIAMFAAPAQYKLIAKRRF